MIKIGLTGSIAMGKSTTAAMFAAAGAPVHDADAAVHRLYAKGGAAVGPIGALCAPAIVDGAVDRAALKTAIQADPTLLPRIEAVVHPLVTADREAFLAKAAAEGAEIVVFDVPLLFETGADAAVDIVVVVSAEADVQRQRALGRPGMTEDILATILSKQLPDAKKRQCADYVVSTDHGYDHAQAQVAAILAALRAQISKEKADQS